LLGSIPVTPSTEMVGPLEPASVTPSTTPLTGLPSLSL
jgi:hypothetical protein